MLSTPQKREAEANGEQQADASAKSTRTSRSSNVMKWKLWLIANYEHVENAVTKTNDIFKHAEDEKDRVPGEPKLQVGRAVNHLFGGKIRLAQRGTRADHYRCYVNLKRRQQRHCNADSNLAGSTATGSRNFDFPLPERWVKIKDHPSHVSFIRHEGWEFNNQRGTTELSVMENDNHELTLAVKCRGRPLDLKTDLEFASVLDQFPAEEQVWIAIQFIEKSSLCMGFISSDDEEVVTMAPRVSGVFKNLTRREDKEVKRVFSLDCLLFAAPENSCLKCKNLLLADNRRKSRRGKRGSTIHPHCNDRYLTKTEMHKKYKQLSKEREAAVDDMESSDEC